VSGQAPPRGLIAKRLAVMEAATRVFLREGFSRASVDAIAAEAKVSKQTIYNHFGDKEHLFLAVIEAAQEPAMAEQTALLDSALNDFDDVERALMAFGMRSLRLGLRPDLAALRRLVIAEIGHHPQLREAWIRAAPAQLHRRLADYLGRVSNRGALDVRDPHRAASQLIALIGADAQNLSMFGTVPLSDDQLEHPVRESVVMFLRAYAPTRRQGNP
jgi:TetR/AcrR family transcriptional regulator, mexJK operon transcriptional repressor